MKTFYRIWLYEALLLLAVGEEMCPGKKKSFQDVSPLPEHVRGVYKNGGRGNLFEHLKFQTK